MARPNDFDDEDDFELEEVTPARRRRRPPAESASSQGKSNTWLIVGIVAGVVGLVGVFGCCILIALLLPAVQQARNAAREAQSKNNLKLVGLAAHNFHDAHSYFPPLSTSKEGGIQNQPHSWATALLPYLEYANLYTAVQFDQPWDAPANQGTFSITVPALINPNVESTGPLPSGYGPAHYAWNSQMISKSPDVRFRGDRGESMRFIADGTSNTLLAGTVVEGIKPWADPSNVRDLALGIGNTSDTFNPVGRGVTILLADGVVRTLSPDTDLAVLQAIATPTGGEVVPAF